MGWIGVGWRRRCKTRQSLLELDNQGNVFFFFFVLDKLTVELDTVCAGITLILHEGDGRIT